jgi:oxygen-independent coproporphyrinogen III oxidase
MPLGIYVHLPFCPYICPYCDFAKWPHRKSAAAQYLAALSAEIKREAAAPAATIFFGGGTPNAYDASDIATLLATLRERFGSDTREITIELNPELVKPDDMRAYVDAGINRVSIGVQSFVEPEIAILGRKHTHDDVERAVKLARDAGITSVSIDLIFAVPGQTLETWGRSLNAAIALGVEHVSTYGLTIEDGTPFFAWQEREPRAFSEQDDEAALYDLAIRILEDAGFEHYEISNFARAGHRCMHNANYWENGPYIGLGVGAASYRDGERSTHTRDLAEYLAAVEAGSAIPGNAERLLGDAAAGEAIMLALRTAQGVGLHGFKERYSLDILERFAATVAKLTEAGMVEVSGDHLRLTRQGRFIANDVCGAFLSLS